MNYLDIILPVALLLLSFLLKLLIDRSIDLPIAVRAICELPVDMIFLSISFLVALLISHNIDKAIGLLYLIVYLIISIVIIVLWRRTTLIYDGGRSNYWILTLMINIFITVCCLLYSITLLTPKFPIYGPF